MALWSCNSALGDEIPFPVLMIICAYNHYIPRTEPIQSKTPTVGCTRVCIQTLLLLWQKTSTNIETKSKNLAATRTQLQWDCRWLGCSCTPASMMDISFSMWEACSTITQNTTPSLPLTRPLHSLSRVKNSTTNYTYTPQPLPPPFAPQTNLFLLARTYWNEKATWCS